MFAQNGREMFSDGRVRTLAPLRTSSKKAEQQNVRKLTSSKVNHHSSHSQPISISLSSRRVTNDVPNVALVRASGQPVQGDENGSFGSWLERGDDKVET